MKISVIIPLFNVEYYLEEAFDSIINQTIFNDIEVIIVDDGSTDNSRFLVEKYAIDYDNINVLHKEHEGTGLARNYGMKYAKGEYIHFFDPDDFLLYDGYEKLYNFAKKEDYDIVTSNFVRFNHEKTWANLIRNYVYTGMEENIEKIKLNDNAKLTWDTIVWNKLFKREFLEKNNFQFHEGSFQDILYSMEALAKASKIGMMKDYMCCWRLRDVGLSATQTFDMKRVEDLIKVTQLVKEFLDENIEDEEVLANKYHKWLTDDIPMFIEMIEDYHEEHHEFLKETAINIYNLVPKEYRKNMNSYYVTLYKILENGDLENLFLYLSNNYKANPELPEGLDEEYLKYIDFKKDAMGEDLETYASNVYRKDEKIVIEFINYIPYLKPKEDDEISVRLVNPDFEDVVIESNDIKKDRFILSPDLINPGENIPTTTYKSGDIEKEFYIKTNSRRSYSYDDYDVDIARGKTSYLRVIKREKGSLNHIVNEIKFEDGKYFELKGICNNNTGNILINDYLDFVKFKYPIDYEKIDEDRYAFSVQIPYNDLLKAPVKKWDFYLDTEFNKLNLEENREFINEQYRIYLKNYGNRMVLELFRYDPIETITKLNNDKQGLIKEEDKLNQDKNKIEQEKQNLVKERKEILEKNKALENKINEYKNRKDVRAVDSIKKIFKIH